MRKTIGWLLRLPLATLLVMVVYFSPLPTSAIVGLVFILYCLGEFLNRTPKIIEDISEDAEKIIQDSNEAK